MFFKRNGKTTLEFFFEEAKKVEKEILTLVGNPRAEDNNTMIVGKKILLFNKPTKK
jgi:hypothetical protein